jgi:hypothetical protein
MTPLLQLNAAAAALINRDGSIILGSSPYQNRTSLEGLLP